MTETLDRGSEAVQMMSVERPLTKLWVCEHCGTLYELLPNASPPRDWAGKVICDDCNEHPTQDLEL